MNLRARGERHGVDYLTWAEEGFITPTPGNTVDLRAVEDCIREACARFAVREIAFDPTYARTMMATLAEDGLPAVEFRQGWVSMAPAVKELERAILARELRHGGHPVLRWNFANVQIETDKAGNRMMHKGKSGNKIDGAVACAMAVARAAMGPRRASTTPTGIAKNWGGYDRRTCVGRRADETPSCGRTIDGRSDWITPGLARD